jgi:hypothetical protein
MLRYFSNVIRLSNFGALYLRQDKGVTREY